MPYLIERRFLQIVILIASLVPISAGVLGIAAGPYMFGGDIISYDAPTYQTDALDSHMSYLSGLLCAVGLGFISCIPRIQTRTSRIRLLTFIVVFGGLARLFIAISFSHKLSMPLYFPLIMELLVTPLICLWQGRIAKSSIVVDEK